MTFFTYTFTVNLKKIKGGRGVGRINWVRANLSDIIITITYPGLRRYANGQTACEFN